MGIPRKENRGVYIGKKIRALREERGMSRQKLWELIGGTYSYDALTKVELGVVKSPPVAILKKIADIFEIPLEELIKADDELITADDLLKDPDMKLLMYQAKDLSQKDKKVLLKIIKLIKEEYGSEGKGEQST